MRNLERKSSLAIALLLVCLFFGSSTVLASQEVLYKGPRGIEEKSQAKTEGALKKESPVDVTYDPTDMTDPFKPFIAEQESVEEKKKQKPKTYLETLDVSQLDLIAIVIGPEDSWAMVRDAKGLGYVIREGTPIGVHEGKVAEIKENEVIIREKRRDFKGNIRYENVSKSLISKE